MKILHLVKDDKFIDSSIKIWSMLDKDVTHSYLAISFEKELKYIKSNAVKVIGISVLNYKKIEEILCEFDIIFVHSLDLMHQWLIHRHKSHKYAWVGMGFDYYDILKPGALYTKKTKGMLNRVEKSKEGFLHKLNSASFKKLIFIIYNKLSRTKVIKTEVIKNICYFAPVLESEFYGVKLRHNNLKFFKWNYGVTAFTLRDENVLEKGADCILIGNSSDPSNNHIDILDMLKGKLKERELIIPASYGNDDYRTALKTFTSGYDLKINILHGFIPLDDYTKILRGCGYVIMNHKRQQAGGNIAMQLFMGAKVFLNPENSFYDYFKSLGTFIFTIDDIKNDIEVLSRPLTEEQMKFNRSIIIKDRGINRMKSLYLNSLEAFEREL